MKRASAALRILVSVYTATGPAVAATSWNDATEVQLAVAGDIGSDPTEYRIEMFSGGDARVTVVDRSVPTESRPAIVLIEGQLMLVKNLELEEGYEIDALDGPILMLQLALSLLEYGVEGGPDSVTPDGVEVEHAEDEESIEISTTSAGGEFPAPWRLTGDVKREQEGGVTYALELSYTAGIQEAKVGITGRWKVKEPRPELDPEMALSGWQSYQIGPIERQYEGSTIYDFGAQPKSFDSTTLRQLRHEISEQD